jgi:hypothetical protein
MEHLIVKLWLFREVEKARCLDSLDHKAFNKEEHNMCTFV